jgi:hypothetical protein
MIKKKILRSLAWVMKAGKWFLPLFHFGLFTGSHLYAGCFSPNGRESGLLQAISGIE